jgi:hypothetical protein
MIATLTRPLFQRPQSTAAGQLLKQLSPPANSVTRAISTSRRLHSNRIRSHKKHSALKDLVTRVLLQALPPSRRLLQQSAPQCTAAGQFIPDRSTGCTRYWQCTGSGVGAYKQCGVNTAFNEACTCCDFPSNFVCGGATATPAPTSQTPTPAPTTKAPTPAPTTNSPIPAPTTQAPTTSGEVYCWQISSLDDRLFTERHLVVKRCQLGSSILGYSMIKSRGRMESFPCV